MRAPPLFAPAAAVAMAACAFVACASAARAASVSASAFAPIPTAPSLSSASSAAAAAAAAFVGHRGVGFGFGVGVGVGGGRTSSSRSSSRSSSSLLRMIGSSPDKKPRGPQPRGDGFYPAQYLVNITDRSIIAFDELYMGSSDELVVYLPNLKEGRDNPLADDVLKHCIQRKRNFLSFDYFGRGDSSGESTNATLSRWTGDAIVLLDKVAAHVAEKGAGNPDFKRAVLVGHAAGAWVSVLVALKRPDLVRGVVGIGADPDFTEDLLWASLPQEDKDEIMAEGMKEIRWGKLGEAYPITRALIEDGRDNLVLRGGRGSMDLDCPVRLIHDIEDAEVPPETSIRLAECLSTDDVVVTMPKNCVKGVGEAMDQCFERTKAGKK